MKEVSLNEMIHEFVFTFERKNNPLIHSLELS